MEFRVLGPVEARRGTTSVALAGSKIHTVLAALLLARGRIVPDRRLSGLLWGWTPPVTANAQIYTYVSRLRRQLGAEVSIVRRQPGYEIRLGAGTLDIDSFERLEQQGRAALQERRFDQASALLGDALGLWQGSALANVTPFMQETELPQLEEARMITWENRIEADLALGRHQQVTTELTWLSQQFPLREGLRAQLITALYRCGRQADAVRVFHEGRAALSEQLGVDPGERLRATYQSLINGELALPPAPVGRRTRPVRPAATRHRTVRPAGARGTTMPAPLADFTGRPCELSLIQRLLTHRPEGRGDRPRCVVITGPAGAGKTALAVQAAHAGAEHFPDGQVFVELSRPDRTPKPPAEVLTDLLWALGDRLPRPAGLGGAPELEELVHRYRARTVGRRLLVVLDRAARDQRLEPLLPRSPLAAVLVTHRSRPAGLDSADTVPLGPLTRAEAARLLASAGGAGRAAEEPRAVDALVEYCDAVPLALRGVGEHLAARPRAGFSEIAERLAEPATRLGELRRLGLDLRRELLPSLRDLSAAGREAFAALAPQRDRAFRAQQAAPLLGLSSWEAEQVLEELVDAALLEAVGVDSGGNPLYRYEALVQLLAASLAGGPARVARPEPIVAVAG
ncbi:hypothetical protein ATKI12_8075 [Kitasatospora sp. Ki12]